MNQDFLVQRDDLSTMALRDAEPLARDAAPTILTLERFALTANNITYGVAGDMIGYWQFFPAPSGWGRIPVWGMGSISHSSTPQIEPGQRYYGYYPMSTELAMQPEQPGPRGMRDASPHRADLPEVYNQYARVTPENGFDPRFDNHNMVFRPLFTTSFVLDDYLADNDFFGARQVILGSASSKTAIGLAFMLSQRSDVSIVGLTSPSNRDFVAGLGLYDTVLSYDEVGDIPQIPAAFVDMAGNPQVLSALHHHLKDNTLASCGVGITHWETRGDQSPADLPGAAPSMFFAPTQIVKRQQELGAAQYASQLAAAMGAFFEQVDAWISITEAPFSDIEQVFRTVLNGAAPDQAYVVVMPQ